MRTRLRLTVKRHCYTSLVCRDDNDKATTVTYHDDHHPARVAVQFSALPPPRRPLTNTLVLNFPVNSSLFSSHPDEFFYSLSNNDPFLHPTCASFDPPLRHSKLMLNSSLQQLPIQNRTPARARAGGNATSKHLKQGSGPGAGPSRSTTFGKDVRERPVLNEVTKTIINGKVTTSSSCCFHGRR